MACQTPNRADYREDVDDIAMELLIYCRDKYTVNENPTEQDVIASIQQLDGLDYGTIILINVHERLFIDCSANRRMLGMLAHREGGFSLLRDKAVTDDSLVRFRLSNGQVDIYPMFRTVEENQMIDTALAFLNETPFSLSENLRWEHESELP